MAIGRRTRFLFYALLTLLIAGLVAWLFGPRPPADTSVTFDASAVGEDVEAWLDQREQGVEQLRDNAAKEIVWAFPASRAKTPMALVYIHGFSAAKAELRPVPDMAAAELDANLFFTRLTGHGRDGPAMAQASVNDWMQDAAEAIAVGNRIGEKTVLIATSTGAALAAIAASKPELRERIAGLVLISPNFRTRAAGSQLLTWPWAGTIVRIAVGTERSFEPINEQQAQNWTESYPSEALLPMAALVREARQLRFEDISVPALFIFHPEDQVVDHDWTVKIAERWGGPTQIVRVEQSGDAARHVIAGDIISPGNNETLTKSIVDFANGLGK